jgi:membrane associated rhomboid family serine protease
MDYLIVLMLAAGAIVGWILGALKPHRQAWILVFIGPALVVLGFYFVWQLFHTQPSLYSGEAEVGWPTLPCMIGGVWALLAKPRTDDHQHHHDSGATAC